MNRYGLHGLVVVLALICGLWGLAGQAGAQQTCIMGTGGKGGLYYPVGRAIAKFFNANCKGHQVSVINTKGSVENLQLLKAGKIQVAMCQADTAYEASRGKLPFLKGKPYKDLRAVGALYNEVLTLVTREKSGIKKLADIKGKRVAVGQKGSGTLQNTKLALSVVGLKLKDLGQAQYLANQAAAKKFKAGQLDALFFTVGAPQQAHLGSQPQRGDQNLPGTHPGCDR
jgi:TRAP transporter TAXI family solute receptor